MYSQPYCCRVQLYRSTASRTAQAYDMTDYRAVYALAQRHRRILGEPLASAPRGTLRAVCEQRGIVTTGFRGAEDFLAALAEHSEAQPSPPA